MSFPAVPEPALEPPITRDTRDEGPLCLRCDEPLGIHEDPDFLARRGGPCLVDPRCLRFAESDEDLIAQEAEHAE